MISAPAALSEAASVLCLILITLVTCAVAGVALINTGLGRSRSAAHAMVTCLCAISIAVLVFFAIGFSVHGVAVLSTWVIRIGGKPWSVMGAEPVFLRGIGLTPNVSGSALWLQIWLQTMCVALAVLIPLGAGADRWRLSAICGSSAIFSAFTYPLFAHWVWGGGWLQALGVNYGLGHGFVDAGGSACIQVVGGMTALSIASILGARRGKYGSDHRPTAIPGHDAVTVLFGCFLAWPGWIALNVAGAILNPGLPIESAALIAMNTTLAAASAGVAAALITRLRFGRPDASLSANGWLCGLVASSAACPFIAPAEAVIVGLVAGCLVVFSVELLELKLFIDDPCGSISVHMAGGIWGTLAVGLFAYFPGGSVNGVMGNMAGQLTAQLIGISTLIGFVFPLTYGLNYLLNRLWPQRVSAEAERQGLDLHELGAGAYPDFIVHKDDLSPRSRPL